MDHKIAMTVWIDSEINSTLEHFNSVNTLSNENIKENINRLKYTLELYEYLNYPNFDNFEINQKLLESAYELIKKY